MKGGEKRKQSQPPTEAPDAVPSKKQKKEPKAFNPNRVFIGQLSYKTTKEEIISHLKGFGVHVVAVRLLTDRKTGKSKGIAFAELESKKQISSALRAHHSRLNGRQINVERSCGGGGKGSKRKEKIEKMRVAQGVKTKREMKELITSTLNSTQKSTQLKSSDFDERIIEALCTFPKEVSKKILEECVEIDFGAVESKAKYVMGVVKKYRTRLKAGGDLIVESDDEE